jgi:flagellar basal body-associated protein FliL
MRTAANRKIVNPNSCDSAGISSKKKLSVLVIFILLVSVMAVTFMVFGKMNILLNFSKSKDYAKPDTYVSIGPVVSTIDSGDLIRMTLDINCIKKSYRNKVTGLDTEIRNRVIWALQTPQAEKFMASGDYVALRAYLGRNVREVIPDGLVREIYISDLLRF